MGVKIASSIWNIVFRENSGGNPRRFSLLRPKFLNSKYYTLNTGFTLIELLVTVAILGTAGVIAANMFFQTLKGVSKAEIEKIVKQEGDYTISVMERMIRNSKNVVDADSVCDDSDRANITITNQDDSTSFFECAGSGDNAHIASNSARLTSNKVRVSSDCNSFVKCTQLGSAPPVLEIKFNLSQAGSPTRPEEQASVNFQTTVSLRNY